MPGLAPRIANDLAAPASHDRNGAEVAPTVLAPLSPTGVGAVAPLVSGDPAKDNTRPGGAAPDGAFRQMLDDALRRNPVPQPAPRSPARAPETSSAAPHERLTPRPIAVDAYFGHASAGAVAGGLAAGLVGERRRTGCHAFATESDSG
jgi:hypothetical protein